jgi:hypothetical protein
MKFEERNSEPRTNEKIPMTKFETNARRIALPAEPPMYIRSFFSSFGPSTFVLRHSFEASRFRIWNFRAGLWLTILLTLGPVGCGYQMVGANGASLYRQDVKTVAVPMITNRTYRRGLEQELTKSVIQQLEEHSNYKVVPKERADTILECEIFAASVSLLGSDSTTGLPQEQEFTIVVNFTWKDLRTGDILVQRKNFDQRANFMPTLGESSTVASTNAIQQLGLAIVQEMQADW